MYQVKHTYVSSHSAKSNEMYLDLVYKNVKAWMQAQGAHIERSAPLVQEIDFRRFSVSTEDAYSIRDVNWGGRQNGAWLRYLWR